MEEKYICLECGEIFDDPKKYSEDLTPSGAFEGGSFIHEYYACPYCEGAYRQAVRCDICGEYVNEEKIEIIDKDYLCSKCYDKLEEKDDE